MSYQETNRVYEREMSRAKRTVMLAYADKTPEGGKTYPSVATVAWMTDYNPRQVQRIKRQLEADGALVEVAPANYHKTPVYELHPEVYPLKTPLRDDVLSPLETDRDDILSPRDAERVTSRTNTGDISRTRGDIEDHRGDIAVSPKRKKNPSSNKSRNASAAPTRSDDGKSEREIEVSRINRMIVAGFVSAGIKDARYAKYDYEDAEWLDETDKLVFERSDMYRVFDVGQLERVLAHLADPDVKASEQFKHVKRPGDIRRAWTDILRDIGEKAKQSSVQKDNPSEPRPCGPNASMSELRRFAAEKADGRVEVAPEVVRDRKPTIAEQARPTVEEHFEANMERMRQNRDKLKERTKAAA